MIRYIRLFRNITNWWLHFGVKFGLTKDDPLIFKAPNNITIEVPRRLLPEFKEIFMEECYTSGLKLRIPERPTVIDIGANAGFFSAFAASQFPGAKVFSYEPIDVNFRQLLRNKAINEDADILCFPKAVCGDSGEVELSFDSNDSFTTSASVFEKSDIKNETVKVPCVSLPEIFDEHHIERCDLLKIDCEGSEYGILYKCPIKYLHRVVQMAMEVHKGTEPDQNIEFLENYLNSHDFKTRRYSNHMLAAWRIVLLSKT
ncbi:MAG: FkbM family methyltransferase [Desulfobacteraceae bacterium]|nr:FkbM family methyltransferase [Desulfobacteraceae bacterium]